MRIGDWRRLTDYWMRHPPACELAEIQMGWQAPAKVTPLSDAEIAQLGVDVDAALAGDR